MAKKVYDKKIDKRQDWGGDESTGNLPVAGNRVQEFIKEQLNSKAGVFHYDTANNRYIVFADEENQDAYFNDPTQTQLIIGTFDAPFNYSAEITLSSPTYKAILAGTKNNYIDFTFDTKNKSGQSVGEDVVATYTFIRNGIKKTITERYRYGTAVHFGIDKYIDTGANNITVGIVGQNTLAATTIGITYQVIDLQLVSNYDVSNHYNLIDVPAATAAIPYRISGYGTKVMEWYVDGVMLDYVKVEDEIVDVSTTRTKYISVSNLNQGKHSLQLRAYTIVDGERFYSDTIYHDLIIYTGADRDPIIGVSAVIPSGNEIIIEGNLQLYGIQQYIPYSLVFSVYNPSNVVSTDAVISVNGTPENILTTHNNEKVEYSLRPLDYGLKTLTVTAGSTVYTIGLNIEKSSTSLEEIKDGLTLDLSAIGKSNSDANREEWVYGLYSSSFSGFYWNRANGWVNNSLLLTNGASVDVNVSPLSPDPTISGRTLEFEFATSNVFDDDAVVCDLRNASGTGLLITASEASMKSAGGSRVAMKFKAGDSNRISFVVNPKTGATNKGLVFIYINGICCGAVNYSDTDNFTSTKTLRIGGASGCDVELKSLRFYNTALNADQILNNYILYRDNSEELLRLYDRNNIYEEGTQSFSVDKLAAQCPVFIFTGDIPTLENTTDKNETIYVDVEYINLQDPSRSFTGKGIRLRPQGTSSMGYPKKNLRPYTGYGEVWDNLGNIMLNGLYSFKEKAQPVNVWCLKKEYAESSNTHNTGVARFWNDILFNTQINGEYVMRTEAQKAALANNYPYDVRTTIDGFPVNVFYRLTPDSELIYMGKYSFNNDKSTESVYGFRDIPGFDNSRVQCWEVLNNGNHLALFQDMDNFDTEWDQAYESRYPDKSTNTDDLKRFSGWVVSTKDNVEKFKAEKWSHLDVYKEAAYYAYCMRFGTVDQIVKNSMLTTEDGEKWFHINYDNKSILGLRNDGPLIYPPTIDRQTLDTSYAETVYAYAGHDSTLWNNFEADDEFMKIVAEVDNALYTAGLTYAKVTDMFDNQQAGKWCERVYNQDAQYSYIGPYTDSGINNLVMLQGSRTSHRRWWLGRRFDLYDSKFVSGAYKAKSIEFKVAAAPAGLTFSMTGGIGMYYGYGINNVPVETGIKLSAGQSHTFTSKQVINVGDPVRIYSAPNVRELDIHNFTPYLSTLNITEVYGKDTGTKLKKLVLGVDTVGDARRNTSLSVISGLASARLLEYLDISGYKGITGIDLSDHIYLRTFKAFESGLAGLTLSDSMVSTLELPASLQALRIENMEYLTSGMKISGGGKALNNILIRNCSKFDSKSFMFAWNNVRITEDSMCDVTVEGINWTNVNVDDLLKLGAIKKNGGKLVLKGRIRLIDVNEQQLTELLSIFGNDVTNPNNELYIIAPDGIFLTGPTEVYRGDSAEYKASVFSEHVGRVEYYLTSSPGGAESQTLSNVTIDKNTGYLASNETSFTNSTTLYVKARHFPTQGANVSKELKVLVRPRIYPTSGNLLGNTSLNGIGNYTYTLETTPVNENGHYRIEWEVSGEAVDSGYVELKEGIGRLCTVTVKSVPVDLITFNIKAKMIREWDNNNFLNVTKDIHLLIPGVIMTATSNPEVFTICRYNGWAANESFMTEIEAASVGTIGTAFKNSRMKSFGEFQYFTGITEIPKDAFNYCTLLESILLPDTVKSIGSSAFFNCLKLKEIVIPEGVTTIGSSAFALCSVLEKANIPVLVTAITNNLFQECKKLSNINFPANLESIGSSAFSNTGLENVVLPEYLATLHGTAFGNCSKLKSIYIGENVSSINGAVLRNCPELQGITISAKNDMFKVEDGVMFSQNTLLKYLPTKEELEYTIPSIIRTINTYAFEKAKLEKIDLSEILSIDASAFSGCVKLEKITIHSNVAPALGASVFGQSTDTYIGVSNPPGTNILYVPEGATGYDEGQWLDPLQAEDKCNFTISYTL